MPTGITGLTNIGNGLAANDGTGDTLRTGADKINSNNAVIAAAVNNLVMTSNQLAQKTPSASLSYLFSEDDVGVSFDASDLETLYQDDAMANQVTAIGQAVGGVLFKPAIKEATNIIAFPDDFTNASWLKSGVTVAADFDGIYDKLVEDVTNAPHYANYTSTGRTVGEVYTTSIEVKASGRTKFRLSATPSIYVDFDLAAGTVIGSSAGAFVPTIVLGGDGYYALSLNHSCGAASETVFALLLDDSGAMTYTGDGSSGVVVRAFTVKGQPSTNAIQPTAGNRPVLMQDGPLYFLRFTAANNSFLKATNLSLRGCTAATVMMAVRFSGKSAATQCIMEHGTGPFIAGGFDVLYNNVVPNAPGASVGNGASAYVVNNAPSQPSPVFDVITVVFDPSAPTSRDQCRIRVNGIECSEQVIASVGAITSALFTARDLYLGARGGTGLPFDGDVFAGMIIGRKLSLAEMVAAEAKLFDRIKSNVVTPPAPDAFNIVAGTYADSRAPTDQGAYNDTSAYARTVFTTDATSLDVTSYNTYQTTFPTLNELGVIVNGTYLQSIAPGQMGVVRSTVSLPAGSGKKVEIVNGPQSVPVVGNPRIGTWLVNVGAAAALTPVAVTPSDRILLYGDSITVGAMADNPTKNSWAMLLRAATTRSVALEAWGYRALYDDCSTSPKMSALVSTLASYAPAALWLAIGTNDYGLNKWSAAAFGAAYAALLDAIHAALPSAVIYAQTPLLRVVETANGAGSTLGDYRSQIASAAASRSGFVTLVDGTTFMTTASLSSDGLHPSTAGHALYASAVKSALGI